MKRELREEVARDAERLRQSSFSRLIDDNISVIKALGVAAAVVLTGFSAVHLVKRSLGKKTRFSEADYLI